VQEHISVKKIEQYRKRQLSTRELLALDDHMAECEACCLQISSTSAPYSSPVDLIPALETEEFEHTLYEQFAAYIDGQLDSVEREIVESHLSCCRQCSRELSDLETLKAQINSHLSPSRISEAVVETSHTRRLTLGERLANFWRVPSFRIPLQVAAAVACVALLVWAVTLPLRKNIAELKSQLAQAEQRNEELQRDFEISKEEAESLQTQVAQLQSADPNPLPQAIATALNDNLVKVDAQGNIEGLAALPSVYQQVVKSAIDTGQVKTPQSISSLRGKTGVLMGGGKEGVAFALVSPLGTAVSSARPTFRWQNLAGATGYTVTVLDMDFNPVSKSPVLDSTSWTIAEPLERGRNYVWVVTAIKDGKEVKSPVAPAPEARFKVLDKEMADEVLKTRRAYRDSHLISGLVYAQAGLLDEAEREFDLLVRANPKSAVARKLLRSIKSMQGR
jgi:type II secretory pathway component PulM